MKRFIIGITGVFGSGKTTVAKIFKRLSNCDVIDADRIAREVLPRLKEKVIREFGNIIIKGKKIDRRRLADVVFNDKKKLSRLNRITHPNIIKEVGNRIKKSNRRLIVLDVPLLIEAKMQKMVDKVIVVKCDDEKIIQRSRFSRKETTMRIASQLPIEKKLKLADYIVDNNGSLKNTEEQVKKMLELL